MMRFHRSSGGIGTIALWEVEDPSAFGVVALGERNRIVAFQEKPPKDQALSNLVNAGAYVFEPEILDPIGLGSVSLERQIFPKVLDRGLFGYRFAGFWVDCGTRENFLRAQRILMDCGRQMMSNTELIGASKAIGPNYLDGVRCVDSVVGPYVSAVEGVVIGKGCKVSDSILMEGVTLRPNSMVKGSIVGPGVTVASNEIAVDSILVLH
jgi:mannose-1-phosphate guanylyltransferase